MDLKTVHIQKREIVGKLHGRDVYHIMTHGGLSIIAAHKNGQLVTVGCGPILGVSKFLAEKREPDIIWATPMVKSDADKDLVCPLCHQLDRPEECLCVYRDGYLPTKSIKF